MCGIFGIIPPKDKLIKDVINKNKFNEFLKSSERRGRDSSGYVTCNLESVEVVKRDIQLTKVLDYNKVKNNKFCFGHSRLITNGLKDNQPVVLNNNVLVHNGIVINYEEVFKKYKLDRKLKIDSEVILSMYTDLISKNKSISESINKILSSCVGTISAVIYSKDENNLVLFSNNGSL